MHPNKTLVAIIAALAFSALNSSVMAQQTPAEIDRQQRDLEAQAGLQLKALKKYNSDHPDHRTESQKQADAAFMANRFEAERAHADAARALQQQNTQRMCLINNGQFVYQAPC